MKTPMFYGKVQARRQNSSVVETATLALSRAYTHNEPVTFNSVTGFDSPRVTADSRQQRHFLRPLFAIGTPSFRRAVVGSLRAAGLRNAGLSTSLSARHPFDSGTGSTVTETIAMSNTQATSNHIPDHSSLCNQHWQTFHDSVTLNCCTATEIYQTTAGLDAILHLLSNDNPDVQCFPDDTDCRLSGYVRGGLLSAAVALNSNLHHLFCNLHTSEQEGE